MDRLRFDTKRVEVSPRQPVAPTERVDQFGSLSHSYTMAQMRPNALAGIDVGGRFIDLRRQPVTVDSTINQYVVVTLSPWGQEDVMVIHADANKPPAFHDIPEAVMDTSFSHQGLLAKKMKQLRGVSYWGVNYSAGVLKGEGLQSVLFPHSHAFSFSNEQANLTPAEISTIRNSQRWDEGVSYSVGQQVGARIQEEVLPLYRPGKVKADAMGLTIELPNFTPADLGDPDFINKLHKPTAMIIHHSLRDLHPMVFRSELDTVIQYVLSRRDKNDVDSALYDRFFDKAELPKGAPSHVAKLHELYDSGELRRSAGWTYGMQFNQEGAFAAISFGFLNISLGPVESMGVKLIRPVEPVSAGEMQRRIEFYNDCIDTQLHRAA